VVLDNPNHSPPNLLQLKDEIMLPDIRVKVRDYTTIDRHLLRRMANQGLVGAELELKRRDEVARSQHRTFIGTPHRKKSKRDWEVLED
jgi:hypothetical protein